MNIVEFFTVSNILFCIKEYYMYCLLSLVFIPILFLVYYEKDYLPITRSIRNYRLKKLLCKPGVVRNSLAGSNDLRAMSVGDDSVVFASSPGNFLTLYYNVENVLRMIASDVANGKYTAETEIDVIDDALEKKKILTESGVRKVDYMRWLKDHIVQGRMQVVSPETLHLGVQIAWNFHRELNFWMRNNENKRTS